MHAYNFCQSMKLHISNEEDVVICWLDAFKAYAVEEGWSFPIETTEITTLGRKKHFYEAIRQFCNSKRGKRYFASNHIGFIDERVAYMKFVVQSKSLASQSET